MNEEDKGKQVLIVEDDPDIRDALVDVLEMESLRSYFATNGAEAIEILKNGAERPDLILLDLMMPGTDGYWFRKEQLKDAKMAGIPVVLMSAHAQAGAIVEELGLEGCLRKPIRIEELLSTIETHIN